MSSDSQGLRILLVDDHPAVRKGLAILLGTRKHEVCAEAKGVAEALAVIEGQEFDLALLDLTLQDGSGLDLLPELEARDVFALVYTMHEDPELIARAFRRGALGYVSKQEDAEILFAALDAVSAGKRYLSPCAKQSLEEGESEGERPEDTLSDREMQIFALVGKGFGNTEISEMLGLSRRTVETYCTRIVRKLDFDSRSELRKYAISVS